MSRIRGQNTRPEVLLRRALWSRGLRYRLHYKTPVGKPDIVFPGPRVAVFVDGCFWHGCPDHYVKPRTRDEFWAAKLEGNIDRDRRQTIELETLGWTVIRLWEHEVRAQTEAAANRVEGVVRGSDSPVDHVHWVVREVVAIDPESDTECRTLVALRNVKVERVETRVRTTGKGWR